MAGVNFGRSGPVRTEQEGALAAVPSTGRASEVERSHAPEADAARALYERHAGQIYSFCLHRLGSREEAEDAVQTTFLNAFRGLRRGVVPEAEAAWLFKIAENVCLTRRRSAWRRGRVESPSDLQAFQDVTPARDGGSGDELIPLGDALAAMPEAQRRAILLREWQGLSYKEIAAEMEISPSAVETLIFRARRSLANALETPWQERRTARPAGQAGRAFNLASVLAWLKTLFAGGTAAKVAVVAVAATGTAAMAAADTEHKPPPQVVQANSASVRSPDPSAQRRGAALLAAAGAEPALERAQPARRTTQSRDTALSKRTGESEPLASAEKTTSAKTAPGRAKEPGTAATGHGQKTGSAAKAKPKPKAKPRTKTKPKAKRKPASKPKPKPKASAPASAKAEPKPQSPPKPTPPPKPQQSKPEASTPPPPPPPPAEKEKGKDGEG